MQNDNYIAASEVTIFKCKTINLITDGSEFGGMESVALGADAGGEFVEESHRLLCRVFFVLILHDAGLQM